MFSGFLLSWQTTHLFLTWLHVDCISTTSWLLLYWGMWNILEWYHLLWRTLNIYLDHLCSISRYSSMEFTKVQNTEQDPTHRKPVSRSRILHTHRPRSPSRQLPNSWAQHSLHCTSHLSGPSICPVVWAMSSPLSTAYNQSILRWSWTINEPHIRIRIQSLVPFFSRSVPGVAGGIDKWRSTVHAE